MCESRIPSNQTPCRTVTTKLPQTRFTNPSTMQNAHVLIIPKEKKKNILALPESKNENKDPSVS